MCPLWVEVAGMGREYERSAAFQFGGSAGQPAAGMGMEHMAFQCLDLAIGPATFRAQHRLIKMVVHICPTAWLPADLALVRHILLGCSLW